MLLNESTSIVTPRLVLRPYRKWHVKQYHQWLEDEELREQTASERLTIEEEEEMQRSWRLDEDKMTFIIHLRNPNAPDPLIDPTGFLALHNDSTTMLGDINTFLHATTPPSSPFTDTTTLPPIDSFTLSDSATTTPTTTSKDADSTTSTSTTDTPKSILSTCDSQRSTSRSNQFRAELEIMLPRPSRQGFALEALQHFLSYSRRSLHLHPRSFFARIGFDNVASLGLFRDRLGFKELKRVEVFRELELGWDGDRDQGEFPWEKEQGFELIEVHDPRNEERD